MDGISGATKIRDGFEDAGFTAVIGADKKVEAARVFEFNVLEAAKCVDVQGAKGEGDWGGRGWGIGDGRGGHGGAAKKRPLLYAVQKGSVGIGNGFRCWGALLSWRGLARLWRPWLLWQP